MQRRKLYGILKGGFQGMTNFQLIGWLMLSPFILFVVYWTYRWIKSIMGGEFTAQLELLLVLALSWVLIAEQLILGVLKW